jgi:hypothetical protein
MGGVESLMKRILFIGLGVGLITLSAQQANAGVHVDVQFGFPSHHYHRPNPCVVYRPVYRSHCEPVYHHRSWSYSSRSYSYPSVVYVRPQPQQVVVMQDPAPVYTTTTNSVSEAPRTYQQLGHDWAKDLRNDIATWDQFVAYLKSNLSRGDTRDYNDFRNGFIAAYGVNGEAAFDKSFQKARVG